MCGYLKQKKERKKETEHKVHQTEGRSESDEEAQLERVGVKYALDPGLRGKRLTVGKNRSDSERKRWEREWRIAGNPTEIALFGGSRRAKEFR